MSQHIPPHTRHGIAVALLALIFLALNATVAPAAEWTAAVPAVLPALDFMEIVHDRSRLIQFSIVAVAFGIALLWWGQKT